MEEIPLTVSIWDSNRFADDLLGEVTLSILDFMEMEDSDHYGVLNSNRSVDWWPLTFATKNGVIPAGEVRLQIEFLPASEGVLVVTAYEGRNLKNMELIGKQDPYCKYTIGKKLKRRTRTVNKGGTNPFFNEEEVEFWIGKNDWGHPCVFSCLDEDVGSDDLIGGRRFSLLPFFTQTEPTHDWFEISNKGKPAGEVQLRFEFFPAGRLKIQCHAGRNLVDNDSLGRQDPYTKFILKTDLVNIERKTKTDTDGGTEPLWEEVLYMPVVHQYEMIIDVYDEDMIGSDDLIGRAAVSLLPVFKKGFADQWIPIGTRDKWGKKVAAGELHIEFDFVAPPGVAFPQRRPDIDCFDDSERVDRERKALTDKENDQKAQADFTDAIGGDRPHTAAETLASKEEMARMEKLGLAPGQDKPSRPAGSTDEFTDQEIEDAFAFIDLDRNRFLGAAELRHILICMGELITDEEVDEMIRMCDTDGDGQVSYDEFYQMVVHPDPGGADFDPAKLAAESGPPAPPKIPGDPTAKVPENERQRLMQLKQQKRKLLGQFCEENRVGREYIRSCFDRWHEMKNKKKKALDDDEVDFEEWVHICRIEETGENKQLFTLYDAADGVAEGTIDMREFLLGMNNFSGDERVDKCRFAFMLYDEDKNGFLTMEELVQVLKATHMATKAQQVMKKAQTIMKQCDRDGDGHIDPEEFEIIAEKFPNILFPNYGKKK